MAPAPDTKLNYIPLHLHSCYSISDGLQDVDAIVKRAAQLGFPALALTDFNNVAGFIRFYNACLAEGIKPIMGADLQLQNAGGPGAESLGYGLTLLAMNRRGKQNLYDILSEAWQQSHTVDINKVCTSLEILARHAEGIMVLNGFRGDLAAFALSGRYRELKARLRFYLQTFGSRFCLEITRTGRTGEREFEHLALELCLKYGIPPVASNDTRFLMGPEDIPEDGFSDYTVHDVRVSIQKKCRWNNPKLAAIYSPEQYLRPPAEMRSLFADLPEALENTRTIAVRCNVKLELDHPRLPRYDSGALPPADCLRETARRGLEGRLECLYPDEKERQKRRPEYEARLEHELKVIIDMDFTGYFLIVAEFIRWSKAHGVPVGPGRGSGGGSLVAYALTITDFDPLRFDLLFERFLNPERVSMPDFDVDFCQNKRTLTLGHVKEHYGYDAVSQIAAYGTLAPRAAILGAGRALGVPLGKVRSITALLSAHHGLTFTDILNPRRSGFPAGEADPDSSSNKPDFATFYQNARNSKNQDDRQAAELISLAIRLEGVIRNIGTHAAGVVIAPTRIADFSPVMLGGDGNLITQFDKDDVGHAGLVKFDFLGLTTLTIIDEALKMINARRARLRLQPLAVADIPFEDPKSFAALQDGQTTGVFQLESAGMRNFIRQLRPERFDDIVVLLALYRPGPLDSGMAEHYVQRRLGFEDVSYPQPDFQDPDLKPILESTYGVIVYQEQVMLLARILAGYTLGGADILRRAMSKKNKAEMDAQRAVFLKGAQKKGKDPDVVMQIFNQVEKFSQYGFNKSHSVGYALLAWWTLWLKVHYPAEFLSATMTAKFQKAKDSLDTEQNEETSTADTPLRSRQAPAPNKSSSSKRSTANLLPYLDECLRSGISITPPDINTSCFEFTVDPAGRSIICGLVLIKGTGEKLAERIMKVREKHGIFRDFFEFVRLIGTGFLTKSALEALIKSGALDQLGPSRAAMMQSIPTALRYAAHTQSTPGPKTLDLFANLDSPHPPYPSCEEWSSGLLLAFEKEVLGIYVSGHPADAFRREFRHFCGEITLSNLQNSSPYEDNPAGPRQVVIAGMAAAVSKRTAKSTGQIYYLLTLDDGTATFQLPLFGEQAEHYDALVKQQVLQEQAQRLAASQAATRAPKSKGKKGKVPLPALILIICGELYQSLDGRSKFQVRSLDTLEALRLQQAQTLTISMDSRRFKSLKPKLRSLLQTYHLKRGTLPPALLPDGKGPACPGCTLRLIIDRRPQPLRPANYKVIPANALICHLQQLAGRDAVRIDY